MKKWRLLIIISTIMVFVMSGCAQEQKLPSEIIYAEGKYNTITELVCKIPAPDENFRVMQGGCVNEKYGWFLIVSAEDYGNDYKKECIILKYDRETMEEIKRSEPMRLGHANDATYISESNELYISQSYNNYYSVVDADTLELKESVKMSSSNYAIEYNASRESFVTTLGNCAMLFWDKELQGYYGGGQPVKTTLVRQGICADDSYIYHVLYSTKSNTQEPESMIFVMDWEGKFVTKIPIDVDGYEPENISLVGDVFYIGCNDGKGGLIYTVKIQGEK